MAKNYRSRRARGEVLRRVAVWGILIFLLAVSEGAFFARLHFLPAAPDLILGAVIAIALVDSVPVAAIAAVGGGFLTDALGGVGASLSPILYFLALLVISGMAEKMMAKVWSWILLMLPGLLLKGGMTLLRIHMTYETVSVKEALLLVLLPEAVSTLLLGIPLYFVVTLCGHLCRGRYNTPLV